MLLTSVTLRLLAVGFFLVIRQGLKERVFSHFRLEKIGTRRPPLYPPFAFEFTEKHFSDLEKKTEDAASSVVASADNQITDAICRLFFCVSY